MSVAAINPAQPYFAVDQSPKVTQLLHAVSDGEADAQQQLLDAIYDQLYAIAKSRMADEAVGHTLQPTALINEAYPRLMSGDSLRWRDRRHFLGAAAEAMRRVLVDYARRKARAKRGGKKEKLSLDHALVFSEDSTEELIALHAALEALEAIAPDRAEVVKLKFFAGLSNADIAETLQISLRTAERHWTFAKAWLKREMSPDE